MSAEFEQALWSEMKRFHYGAYMVLLMYDGTLSAAIVEDFVFTYCNGHEPCVLRNDYV